MYPGRGAVETAQAYKRIRAGARLRNYHRSTQMSAEEYVSRVINGEIGDPTLSFQLRQGFHALAVLPDYLRHDPESLGYAAMIQGINRKIARKADYAGRDPRFVRHFTRT